MCVTKFGTHDFDCKKCQREAAARLDDACKQVEECMNDLRKYGAATVPEFCKKGEARLSVLAMLNFLDADSWYECIMHDFNDMAGTDEGKVTAYDSLINSAKARLQKYFVSRIAEL